MTDAIWDAVHDELLARAYAIEAALGDAVADEYPGYIRVVDTADGYTIDRVLTMDIDGHYFDVGRYVRRMLRA